MDKQDMIHLPFQNFIYPFSQLFQVNIPRCLPKGQRKHSKPWGIIWGKTLGASPR